MIQKSIFLFLVLFSSLSHAKTDRKIVLGFSQIGAESAWRVANTKSIKDAADKAGISLAFNDAQQLQANQIRAIKSFILQKVDIIAFAPVVTTGWNEVLKQAKKANIPVIILDREIDSMDTDLYVTFIGSNFHLEGERAAKCMLDQAQKIGKSGPLNIVELRGTEGSAPAMSRKKGFESILARFSQHRIIHSEGADFKENRGKELMETILKEARKKNQRIDALFSHNDNMALGAISAIEALGLKPGKDIVIVSVDAIRDVFRAMQAGKLNCTVECSPLLGPQLMDTARKILAGQTVPRRVETLEQVFPAESAEKEYSRREY